MPKVPEEAERQQRLSVLAKLKKTIKQHNKAHPDQALEVIGVGCMDLCPKNGVAGLRHDEPEPAFDPLESGGY